MVSPYPLGSKIFVAAFTLFLLLVTINQALAQEVTASAHFDSPESNLALLEVETLMPAICQYGLTEQTQETFEQTGDLQHKQRVVIQGSRSVYVQCQNLQGQTYELVQLQLQAPVQEHITARVIAPPAPSSSPNYLFLLGLIFVTTLLMVVFTKPKKVQAYKSLPSYSRVQTTSTLPELSTQALQSILHHAHKEIDTQHFQESLTKYKYLISLVQTHRVAGGHTQQLNQQIQLLYSKLNLYNHLLLAHKQWTRNNKTSLQQTMHQIQKQYNGLRHHDSKLLRNAYKSYAFYESYLKRVK